MVRTSDCGCRDAAARGELGEGLARLRETRSLTGELLPAPNCGIDVLRIELHAASASPSFLGGYQGRAATAERVEDDAAALGAIPYRVRDKGRRLHGWVHGQLCHALRGEAVDAG